MLPPYDCADCEPCCDTFYVVANQILETALSGLRSCGGDTCCEDLTPYVAHGPNVLNPIGDYLAVWLAEMSIAPDRSGPSGSLQVLLPRAAFGVKLMEKGYPMPQTSGTTFIPPQTVEIAHAAKHSLAHAEAVMRAVINAAQLKEFGCGYLGMIPLLPVQPMGGLVGWQFGVTVGVDW